MGGAIGRRALAAGVALSGACVLAAALALGAAADRDADRASAPAGAHGSATRWTRLADALQARSEVAAARSGDVAYVVGGFSAQGVSVASAEAVSLTSRRRTRLPEMPFALNHPAAATWRGALYVVGGYRAARGLSDESAALLRYSPRTRRWTRLRDMPTPRGALTAGVVGGQLVAAGGARGGSALTTVEIYDIARRRWRSGPPLGVAREHLGGAVLDGRFYVLAGRSAASGNLRVAERIGPSLRRWERLPSSRVPRGGTSAGAAGGLVVLVGGEELTPGGRTIAPVEAFDPRARRWRDLPAMRTPRHGLGVAGLGRSVFAIAGGPTPGLSTASLVERLVVSR